MNVLVTGGAGFIGSHIVELLLKSNVNYVRVIDNLSTGSLDNLKHLFLHKNLEFINGSITDYDFCVKVMEGMDVVCHQAASASVPESIMYPQKYHDINVTGFLNILNAAKINGIKRVVYASSSAVYGDDVNVSKQEGVVGNLLSPYALTKYMDEFYADMYTRLYGMECIGLRYFNVFGPRQDPNGPYSAAIPKFINLLKDGKSPTIFGDGLQTRDFVYVGDVANANYLGLTTDNIECFGSAFNVGTGESITVLDLVDNINKIMGKSIEPVFVDKRAGDVDHSLANVDKIKKNLNWKPNVSFIDGLEKTIHSV
jgi:UDP-N-acetylglucosamine 4-epimerase